MQSKGRIFKNKTKDENKKYFKIMKEYLLIPLSLYQNQPFQRKSFFLFSEPFLYYSEDRIL